jgi:hypothetical protein
MSRPKGKITNCPHTDSPHFALGRCKTCYRVFHTKQIGITKGGVEIKRTAITECPHIDQPHYSRGMCQKCYNASRNKGLFKDIIRHAKLPAWKIVKGLEEGKSYYEIAAENKVNISTIIERCKVLGIHIDKVFTNAKEIKKLSRIGRNPNRIVTVSKSYFEKLGIDSGNELFYKLHSNPETKRIEIQVMDKQEAKEEWEKEKTTGKTRYGRKNPYSDRSEE